MLILIVTRTLLSEQIETSRYLWERGLLNTDYPTDTARFNDLLEEREQKKALEEQERAQEKAQEEANTPSWTRI